MGIEHLVLGPMPPRQFIEVFFPLAQQDSCPSAFKKGMFEPLLEVCTDPKKPKTKKEALMYEPFVRILLSPCLLTRSLRVRLSVKLWTLSSPQL